MIIEEGTDLSYSYFNNTELNGQVVLSNDISATNVTDMHFAFSGCSNITDVTSYEYKSSIYTYTYSHTYTGEYIWDNIKYSYEYYKYYHCTYTIPESLTIFNGGYVKDMNHMFQNCYSLSNVDLSYFNISECCDMRGMFQNCYNLSSVVFGRYAPNTLLNAEQIFEGCYNLSYVYVPAELETKYGNIIGQAGYKTRLYKYVEPDLLPKITAYHIIKENEIERYTTLLTIRIEDILVDNAFEFEDNKFIINIYNSDTNDAEQLFYTQTCDVNYSDNETYIENTILNIPVTNLDITSFILCVELTTIDGTSVDCQTYLIDNIDLRRYINYVIYTVAFLNKEINNSIIMTPYSKEFDLADYKYDTKKNQISISNEVEYDNDEEALFIKTLVIE